jgi:uncharacterized membrane protein
MVGKAKRAKRGQKRDIFKLLTIILAFLGAAVSIYLLVLKYTQAVSMCVGSHGCITVNTSAYSSVYGVPVALIGLIGYLIMAVQTLLEEQVAFFKEQGSLLLMGESLVGVIFSAYLTWIEVYVIHAVCPFCVSSAIIILLMFILAVTRLIKQSTH